MCLGIPMIIIKINENNTGTVELEGTQYDVDFSMIEEPVVGDHVIVHAGFAIEKLDSREADTRIEMFSELAELYREGDTGIE